MKTTLATMVMVEVETILVVERMIVMMIELFGG